MSGMKNWNEYRPTKTIWLWSCVGAAALTMIVGFTVGGWVTQGTAVKQLTESTDKAVAQLAAAICANRFMDSEGAATALVALKETDSWKRDQVIEEGGWVTFANMEEPVEGAAQLCATQLMAAGGAEAGNGA